MIKRSLTLVFVSTVLVSYLLISCTNCTSRNTSTTTDTLRTIKPVKKIIIHDSLTDDELMGKMVPEKDSGFVKVDVQYTSKKDVYLRKKVYEQFKKMYAAADSAGIKLVILSATRTFKEQKWIWENKWNGRTPYYGVVIPDAYPDAVERAKYILKYSSMPGTSRHHWGTDIDLNSMELSFYKSDNGKKVYEWLNKNAYRFGFAQPFTKKDSLRPTGYEEEKWHWSYYPLSSQFLAQYQDRITYLKLKGFDGSETATQLDVIKNYVSGVNPKCK